MNLIDKSINIQISPNISILLPLNQKKIYNPKNIKKKNKAYMFFKRNC